MLTYLMVARVAQLCPGAVLTKLDKLVEPLKSTVTTKVSKILSKENRIIFKQSRLTRLTIITITNYHLGQGKFCKTRIRKAR